MARTVLLDQFHLSVFVPRGLSPPEGAAIQQILDDPTFQARLRRAARRVVRRYPVLHRVRLTLSR